jgi:LAO/AO transport system kinase
MNFSDQELIDGVSKGDLRVVARLITLAENGVPRARAVQRSLFPRTGRAHVVGVTGAPGAGKSTLVDQLAREWRSRGKKVAILAVDPTSPFSGGAILGDRIRMSHTSEDPSIFIRSMATRGSLGGLSKATLDTIQILDAAGFDLILVETVGVGQAEVDIVRTADTVLVVLVPGMGDSVQIIKAGILEIADLFVINKADRDGADMLHKDLRILLSLAETGADRWEPLIARTIATSGTGASEVVDGVQRHSEWVRNSALGKKKRLEILEHNILQLLTEITLERSLSAKRPLLKELVEACYERKIDPYSAVDRLLADK